MSNSNSLFVLWCFRFYFAVAMFVVKHFQFRFQIHPAKYACSCHDRSRRAQPAQKLQERDGEENTMSSNILGALLRQNGFEALQGLCILIFWSLCPNHLLPGASMACDGHLHFGNQRLREKHDLRLK